MSLLLAAALASLTQATCYDGPIGAGPRLRRVIVEVVAPASATLHLYSRPPRNIALSTTPDTPAVLRSADGIIAVELNESSARFTSVAGRDTTHATLLPISSKTVTADVAGNWMSAVGPGGVIRLGARLATGPCGTIIGVFDSPDQGQKDLPVTGARMAGDSIVLEAGYMDLRVAMHAHGKNERRATMRQNGVESEIVMRRGTGTTLRRPQEPVRPFPYAEHEVRFASRSPGIQIGGTLTVPNTRGPHPAIVFISGSGAQDRDETVAGHRPFLVLGDHLTRLGYAVLRTDDRGVGITNGNALQTGLHDVADDVRGALDFLRTRPEVDLTRIGLLGHSEGGYIAPIVAATDSSIAFMMLLGGPAAKGRDVLTAQRSMLSRASDDNEMRVKVDSLFIARLFDVFDKRPDDARLAVVVDSAVNAWLAGLPAAERKLADEILAGRTAAQDSTSISMWQSRWFKSIYHHDPAPFVHAVQRPTFALIGELDLQVPTVQNIPAFETLYASRRDLLTLHRLPGINHMLQRAKTGMMEEYMEIEETIAPDVLRSIDNWLSRIAPIAKKPE